MSHSMTSSFDNTLAYMTPTRPMAATPPSRTSCGVNPEVLPIPTCLPPDSSKKSHARKQAPGHIARPRNAFILFRCDFVRQKKVPTDVENDHRNISRIAGTVWREMSQEQKEPWVLLAEQERQRHLRQYPGYRYIPAAVRFEGLKKKKRERDADVEQWLATRSAKRVSDVQSIARRSSSCPPVSDVLLASSPLTIPVLNIHVPPQTRRADSFVDLKDNGATDNDAFRDKDLFHGNFLSLRRSTSCPPGSTLAHLSLPSSLFFPSAGTIPPLLTTRDDSSTFPSRPPVYHASERHIPDSGFASSISMTNPRYPVLDRGAYALEPPLDVPGWDCAPTPPVEWTWFKETENAKILRGFDHFGIAPNELPTWSSPSSSTLSLSSSSLSQPKTVPETTDARSLTQANWEPLSHQSFTNPFTSTATSVPIQGCSMPGSTASTSSSPPLSFSPPSPPSLTVTGPSPFCANSSDADLIERVFGFRVSFDALHPSLDPSLVTPHSPSGCCFGQGFVPLASGSDVIQSELGAYNDTVEWSSVDPSLSGSSTARSRKGKENVRG